MSSPAIHCACPRAVSAWDTADGAHAPNEYFLIESANPKVQGMDGGVRSYVEFLYAMAS